jgi:DtxR family transcriptional regulator, Mn-dependent transcriptional regulator
MEVTVVLGPSRDPSLDPSHPETSPGAIRTLDYMAPYQTPEYHPAFEEYCEAIFELHEDEVEVIQARIAERLDVSRPAVSEMIHRMQREGLVVIDGTIRLTAAGSELAETVVRRHRIAERFLTDVLGLSWADAHAEAGKWEHVISPAVEIAMNRLLGGPTTCPHGNPIPGSGYVTDPTTTTLDTVEIGQSFTVRRITEEIEFAEGLLDFLESSAVQPGVVGTVTATAADGTSTVEIAGDRVDIDAFMGARILVTPSG